MDKYLDILKYVFISFIMMVIICHIKKILRMLNH